MRATVLHFVGSVVGGVRAELLLSVALAVIVAGFSTYLALG